MAEEMGEEKPFSFHSPRSAKMPIGSGILEDIMLLQCSPKPRQLIPLLQENTFF